MANDETSIIVLLRRLAEGDDGAGDALLFQVHDDLRRIAAAHMAGQAAGHLLQTTALVNEAVVRLMMSHGQWHSRKHFFASAACIMRLVLVDHARRRMRQRAFVDDVAARANQLVESYEAKTGDLQKLNGALRSLAGLDPDGAQLVDLRFFLNLSMEESAKVLGMSLRSTERKWSHVRTWLFEEMSRDA